MSFLGEHPLGECWNLAHVWNLMDWIKARDLVHQYQVGAKRSGAGFYRDLWARWYRPHRGWHL